MTEADIPPVRRWADLPEAEAQLGRAGFEAWQAGRLDDADEALHRLRDLAASGGGTDAMFHALHLLACVAFSRDDYGGSRALHDDVLRMCDAMSFAGGSASSLFDLAMIDQAEGNMGAARRHYEQARDRFSSDGYHDQLVVVDRPLASFSE